MRLENASLFEGSERFADWSPQELEAILAGIDASFPRVTDSPPMIPKNSSITRT